VKLELFSEKDAMDENKHKYIPIMLDVTDKKILMIGAGKACAEKIRGLQAADVQITLIAPQRNDFFLNKPWILYDEREYKTGDLAGYDIVYSGVNNQSVTDNIIAEAKERNVLINIVDKPEHSDFISPSVIKKENFSIFISTYGKGPGMTKKIRKTIENDINLQQLDQEAKEYIDERKLNSTKLNQ